MWRAAAVLPLLWLFVSAAQAEQVVVPTQYATIAEAMAALDGNGEANTIVVKPGTYAVNLTLIDNLTLLGQETARTFLEPATTGQPWLITISGRNTVRVSNFTLRGGSSGVLIANSSNVRVSNNVFHVDSSAAGLSSSGSTVGVAVENNTFYANGTALSRDSDRVIVTNNLFAGNAAAISPAAITAGLDYNGFFANTSDGTQGTNATTGTDARFANTSDGDFHLVEGSAAIDSGSPAINDILDGSRSDLGAYGGTDADRVPFPVQNLRVTGTTDDSVSLSWERNRDYHVTNSVSPGGYRLYFGPTDDFNGTGSPTDVGDVNSHTLAGPASGTAPAVPTGLRSSPANEGLRLNWNGVSGASGYRVHWGVTGTGEHQQDVGDVTSYELRGLTNGTVYHVAVGALAQGSVFVKVTALDNTADEHESASIKTLSAAVGSAVESPLSAEVTDYPEVIEASPNLPDEGCFIATAAFGYYEASQVQALRDFRDRFLKPNRPGASFVTWYYRHSPPAARWLNQHPALKPWVRGLLSPAVVIAELATGRRSPWPPFGWFLAGMMGWRYWSRGRREQMA